MATDKILDLEVFDVDSSGVCTADGGFVGNLTGGINYGSPVVVDDGETISLSNPVSMCDGAVTLPDGTVAGQSLRVVNVKAGTATITGDFSGANNTLVLAAQNGIELVWVTNDGASEDESAWKLLGNMDGTAIALSTV